MTWNTRPALQGSALADVGSVIDKTWVEYDVSAFVRGNGDYGFGLIPDSTDGVKFFAEEAWADSSRSAQLVLTLERTYCTYRGSGGGGLTEWKHPYGTTGNEFAKAMATDGTGQFVIAGAYDGSGTFGGSTFPTTPGAMPPSRLVLARYGVDGRHLWSRAYGTDQGSLTAIRAVSAPRQAAGVRPRAWRARTPRGSAPRSRGSGSPSA